ncbi:MAG: hypothetical protein CM15mL5_0340 [uncultured marine virus]|nr:MAG: hypothetical protein CM15mL5_0340 [uncultured marine virus]
MSEQQDHLKNLLSQRDGLISEINELNAQATGKRELLLRASGAIEYLQQIGIELPKEEETPEAPQVEGEVVNAEGDIPEPTPEG